ncbi:MAG TPA: HEPN domain-containing protein [Acidobacteriota bacterium]|nr:HEPN domain-containing protein [Acidobacteriota bacterium]
MKLTTTEWIDKAEGDWASAQREVKARKSPNFDAACFHAQQCIEKYLKARLEEAGLPIQKTHNLLILLNDVLSIEPTWSGLSTDLGILTTYAVSFRYPGSSANKAVAQDALKRCRKIRQLIRGSFGLPV